MIKSTRNGYCDHVRILSARVENSGELGWVWLQFGRGAAVWEGRGGMGKKKKEKQRKRVLAAYNGFFRWNHRRIHFVGDSVGDSATSLYGYLSLNPSVIPSVKSSDVTTTLHISRQTVYPVGETVGIYR